MAKIKLTKNELKVQRDALKRFERYLPTLQLKKQQLQLEVRQAREAMATLLDEIQKLEASWQETLPLLNTGDFFRKIVVTSGFRPATSDELGIVYVGIIPFLLDSSILLG